jgi:hypothetical protein
LLLPTPVTAGLTTGSHRSPFPSASRVHHAGYQEEENAGNPRNFKENEDCSTRITHEALFTIRQVDSGELRHLALVAILCLALENSEC